jgi:hypothetical protein
MAIPELLLVRADSALRIRLKGDDLKGTEIIKRPAIGLIASVPFKSALLDAAFST